MAADCIRFSKEGGVARIIINRPQYGNVVNPELACRLRDACSKANDDDDIYCVVISSEGRDFCRCKRQEYGPDSISTRHSVYPISEAVAAIRHPVIAAIQGEVLGQGLELALACDLRIAARSARLGLPDIAEGRIPSDGGTQRLARLVGRAKALELILTAGIIDAVEALSIGLVSRVVPDASLETEANRVADVISKRAPIALRYAKEAVNRGLGVPLAEALCLETDLYYLLQTTGDRVEGIEAFKAKKQPWFRGR